MSRLSTPAGPLSQDTLSLGGFFLYCDLRIGVRWGMMKPVEKSTLQDLCTCGLPFCSKCYETQIYLRQVRAEIAVIKADLQPRLQKFLASG